LGLVKMPMLLLLMGKDPGGIDKNRLKGAGFYRAGLVKSTNRVAPV